MIKIGFVVALMILLMLSACDTSTSSKWVDGSYEGSAMGMYGEVVINVVIEKGRIITINIVNHSESPGITDLAFTQIPQVILEKQSVDDIDSITGATITSVAIIEAINEALMKAEKQED